VPHANGADPENSATVEKSESAPNDEGAEVYWLEQTRLAVKTGKTEHSGAEFYGQIMKLADKLAAKGDSADDKRRRAMNEQRGRLLWQAHNMAEDRVDRLPGK
jgi:hypothetical protein